MNNTAQKNRWAEHTSKPSWAIVYCGRVLTWHNSEQVADLHCIACRRGGWSGASVEFFFNQQGAEQ